jgi:hypothetical protein
VVLCGLGLVGLLALPAEIKKIKSKECGPGKLALIVAADLAFVVVGLVMLAEKF